MSRYILSAAAKQDLKDIKNYIIRFNLGAAERFLDAFEEKCVLLSCPICPLLVFVYFAVYVINITVLVKIII
ncbi:MAG: type II toxin-antitoxin system RelE/ParE family toxin [Nostoc sp.]|uniref:type II toxin-antitoxin system RelE/ParE family toxin n=1 Tax=Nostoc sp. TaxID=1180 RepID=UPI002FFB63B3